VIGRERTLQQRDPLAALVGRPAGYFAALGIPAYGVLVTVLNRDLVTAPALAVLALALTAAAGAVLVYASSPVRAPFTERSLALLVGLSLAALLSAELSLWQTDTARAGSWAAPALGLYLVAVAPYRPAKQIATAGVLSAIFAGVLAVVQADDLQTGAPAMVGVIIATTPILACSLASAAFADVIVRDRDNWRSHTRVALDAESESRGASIARSVQQHRVTIINRDVVPLFSALDGGEVTESTRRRAREIADSLRALMVSGVDRSWLEAVAERAVESGAAPITVTDRERLADLMTIDERTALRAVMVAIERAHGATRRSTVELVAARGTCIVTLRVVAADIDHTQTFDFAPYLAVLGVIFDDVHFGHIAPVTTVRFSYEQR
jgi:hypothetical protein